MGEAKSQANLLSLDKLLGRDVPQCPLQILDRLIDYMLFIPMHRLGPGGTAVCVYRADFGVNRGIVGVFNDNLVRDNGDGTTSVLRNLFFTVRS